MNQLATPGLGSLIAGRRLAGGGQLLLSLSGFVLVTVWFWRLMLQFYGQISGNVAVQPVGSMQLVRIGQLIARVIFGGAYPEIIPVAAG